MNVVSLKVDSMEAALGETTSCCNDGISRHGRTARTEEPASGPDLSRWPRDPETEKKGALSTFCKKLTKVN
eukprot:NODE_26690_length_215_cov_2.433735_g25520_i0.p1 GENE.NODE_26690_length_215_cov_2.433735_g25520_i0~~NODE_26690_length_215_cov_2.433735_g25520_i0.p1  ORF type:complete len:71 (+),score=0.40 NODE_26690_length_215_cov_2.433735_g25520_i0:3-215(+)